MANKKDTLDSLSYLIRWILKNSIGWSTGMATGTLLSLAAVKIPWINEDRFFGFAALISHGLSTGAV